jgi:hypothetical protein
MQTHLRRLASVTIIVASFGTGAIAQHPTMPSGMTHEEHLAQMRKEAELKRRGAAAMGFDQDATTHHFRLYETGGAIEVVANRSDDQRTVGEVRAHLKEIAAEFSRGDFAKPFATHGEVPPGVATMQRLRDTLTFKFEAIAAGGRVRITASDPDAKAALHDFLRYQIREHATGDSLDVSRRR